ncbi:MAG: hypothetical protein GY711_34835 [bacterium]|nr:hypothetical protein [bacterium]
MVSTRAAWHEGKEVVEVRYDAERLAFEDLLDHAVRGGAAAHVYTTTDRQLLAATTKLGARASKLKGDPRPSKDSDQLYYLRRSALNYVPLTPVQARRVNAAFGTQGDAGRWLSPRQRAWRERIQSALANDPKKLAGLRRPARVQELGGYELELAKRLAR